MSYEGLDCAALVERHIILTERNTLEDRGVLANMILSRVHTVAEVRDLEPLFNSSDLDCTKTLVFVLSEIGGRSVTEMAWVARLLDHSDEWVRHYTIVTVQRSGTLSHGHLVAKAIGMVRDVRAVRAASLKLLSFAGWPQIATSLDYLVPDLREAVSCLESPRPTETRELLARRAYLAFVGVAAAIRARQDHPELLDIALRSTTDGVAEVSSYLAQFRTLPPGSSELLHRLSDLESTDIGDSE